MPTHTADGKLLPGSCFNPYDEAAPKGTWDKVAKAVPMCARKLLGLNEVDNAKLLMIEAHSITASMDLDALMLKGGYDGFCIHSERDVMLCGLEPGLSAATFRAIAAMRGATCVLKEAPEMAPLIAASAKALSGTFTIHDDYTTRFGYSTNQLSGLGTAGAAETLARAIARGGVANMHFKNLPGPSLGSSRAGMREQLVQDAQKASRYFRNKWVPRGRPRVTGAFRTDCEWIRAPFSLKESLPLQSDIAQVRLATWETALRGVEEHLMLSIWGSLPNVTWARILAKVLEKAAHCMGDFDVDNYRQWANAPWRHAHGVGPGQLGCPWKGGGGRILPKGAAGIQTAKEMHDDDNEVICLGCWSSMTEADTETDLCFLINGHEVFIRACAPRNLLFMGYIPHESRAADRNRPAQTPRVHHSAFGKPEAEHLAASVLSNLPRQGRIGQPGTPWRIQDRKLLRPEAFYEDSMRPILRKGAEDARCEALLSDL
jgi:hypothetical protein